MEHRSNNCQYYGEPKFHNNLFRYRNQFERMLRYCFGYHFSWFVNNGYCHCVTGVDLCRWIEYAYGQWCIILFMEHRSDNSQHHGEPEFNDNVFCDRN